MATLGNLFSADQITALKAVATAQTEAQQSTQYVCEKAWEMLYDMAANLGQKLDKNFWRSLDTAMQSYGKCVVCMKGKHDREIMDVRYDAIWARHLGEMLKKGYQIVRIFPTFATVVNWDNWSTVYNSLTRKPDTHSYDRQYTRNELRDMREKRRKEKEFYDLARPIRAKKGGRMRISFEEARDQRVRVARASYESKVSSIANQILQAL